MASLWKKMFIEHPRSVSETYFQHLLRALYFAFLMIAAGFACLVHAFLPGLFTRFGSRTIIHLFDCMVKNRDRTKCPNGSVPSFSETDVPDSSQNI